MITFIIIIIVHELVFTFCGFCSGLVSPSTSVEPKDPAQGKRARGEEAGGKRVRKANPIFADYLPTDKVFIILVTVCNNYFLAQFDKALLIHSVPLPSFFY